jgi:hypothetical protein
MNRLTSFFGIVAATFLLLTTSSFRHTASAQEPTPTVTPGLSAEQKKMITNVQDAIKGADAAIQRAEDRRRTAAAHIDSIKSLTASKKADDAALRDLEDLIPVIGEVADAKFQVGDADHPALKDLTAAETKLTAAKNALPATGNQPDEIVAAGTNAESAQERVTAEKDSVRKTRTDLNGALGKAYPFASNFTSTLSQRLDSLFTLEATAKGDRLRQLLPRQFSNLRQVERLSRELISLFDDLKTQLNAAGVTPVDISKELQDMRSKRVNELVKRALGTGTSSGWLANLRDAANVESENIATKRNQVRSDPVRFSAEAVETARADSPWLDDLRLVRAEWQALEVELPAADDIDFDAKMASDIENGLELSARKIRGALSDLQDALTGDFSNFEADQVSLFYFSDVPRLMQILNPATYEIGGISTAAEEAAKQRKELTTAELDLGDAQIAVSNAQTRLVALREELRQANAAADSTNLIFKKTTLALKGSQRDKDANDKRFTDAQCDPAPTDPEKRVKCAQLAEDRDNAAARLESADRRNKDAEEDRNAANERRDALRDEQNGLPSKIAEAESKLETAQAAVDRQRRTAILAAQAESEAFAKARDNRPFWFAPANASSTDPAKHVIMWAFNDSKTIFLRGTADDLKVVRCIIAKIDQPAPQARMTLWTLELSSDSSTGGAKKTNKALEIVDERLSNTRALNAAALSLLRDVINERVNQIAQTVLGQNRPGGKPIDADDFRLARLKFYSDEILFRMGLDPDKLMVRQSTDPDLARMLVPDPAGTTTLGEALMVLSLGRREDRLRIMNAFSQRLPNYLRGLGLKELPSSLGLLENKKNPPDVNWFPSLRRALNLDAVASTTDEVTLNQIGSGGLSASQLEILHGMEETANDRLLDYVKTVYRAVKKTDDDLREKRREINEKLKLDKSSMRIGELPPPCPNATDLSKFPPAIVTAPDQLRFRQLEIDVCTRGEDLRLVTLQLKKLGVSWTKIQPILRDQLSEDEKVRNQADERWNSLLFEQSCSSSLRTANAREAAADEMLKLIIIAMEDDLDRLFVQPMLVDLRKDLISKAGIGVGIIQRTSVLATNRLLARVDPRASAQLPVGQTTDVLQATQQLAQIFFAAQSGGALGALGALRALPQKSTSELYGLTTGNVFQVTPIFDPSGQALRFKFDYVEMSQIHEPNGTVNPQLPRIERHTVNTEVQLSNLELREVSRFESNARLGIATRYAGGIPLLKDIPYVKYVPLIGWFVRTSGKAAVTQQSLIFGQTTMYPTIGDIMGLLTSDVVITK